MKLRTIIISILIVLFALISMGQSGCGVDDVSKPKPPMPTGKFQADFWVDMTTMVYFGNQTVEKRDGDTYIIAPAGVADSFIVMNFVSGSSMRAEILNRWSAGSAVMKVVEADPNTGAPIHGVQQVELTWDMYTEAGQLLFTGAGHIPERHYYFNKDGVPVKIEDVKAATAEGAGVGPYEGHTIMLGEVYTSMEMRDGKPYLHGVWKGGEIR